MKDLLNASGLHWDETGNELTDSIGTLLYLYTVKIEDVLFSAGFILRDRGFAQVQSRFIEVTLPGSHGHFRSGPNFDFCWSWIQAYLRAL